MKNVVLVNPPALTRAELHDLPNYPHTGLGYLASSLQRARHPVRVVDAKLERLSPEAATERVVNLRPDLVGITFMTHEVESAVQLAESIKQNLPRTLIAAGGVHVTALPTDTLQDYLALDFAVFGEGEETLVELVDVIDSNGDLSKVSGVAWRNGSIVHRNPDRPWIEDLDALDPPAWDLFPPAINYHIVTARGCPYPCVFCMSPYGKKVRERSPKNVISEMRNVVQRYRPRHYKLNDESFAFNTERAFSLLDLMIEDEHIKSVPKTASLRADSVNKELMDRMKEAGFVYVDFGIETGDPDILRRIKKGITMDDARRAVKCARAAGLLVGGNFILGHPGETTRTARRTIRFAVELNCDFNAFGIMTPYPGTQIYDMAQNQLSNYRLKSVDWKAFNKQLGGALELDGFPRFKLEIYQLAGYLSVYLLNLRLLSFAKFVWDYRLAAYAFIRNTLPKAVRRR